MPREEAYSEVPGRGPTAASFNPVVPMVVFVYQSLTESTAMLSFDTVLTVTGMSLAGEAPPTSVPAAVTILPAV